MNLDAVLAGTDDDAPKTAVVDNLNPNGTVDLVYLKGIAQSVPVLATGYVPRVGDVVQILRRGAASLLVLGQVRTSNAPNALRSDLSVIYNVDSPPASSAASAGVLNVAPTLLSSFRSGTGWSDGFAAQGAYETRYGYYQGCFFYGAGAFDFLRARTVTAARITLTRLSGSGVFAAEPIHLFLTLNASKPGGAPFITDDLGVIGSLATGTSGVFPIPTVAGQRLALGQALGLAVRDDSTGNYLRLTGGALALDWRE